MNYKLLTFNINFSDEFYVPAITCMSEIEYEIWKEKKIHDENGYSKIYASLGIYGDGFEDMFAAYTYAGDLLSDGTVTVFDVNEDFKSYFNLAGLQELSLCNVFNFND